MSATPNLPLPGSDEDDEADSLSPACVLVFNASDPSGAAGLSADITAVASVGAHALPVVTGAYARDTSETVDHFSFDDEAVTDQARTILEDVEVQVIKVGFVGSPENLSAIAQIAADYADVPLVAYMPSLAWWTEMQIEAYQDAFKELLLPQTTVLVGNHSTLWRWLLPDWDSAKNPTARDIARAAQKLGVPYTLVTGIPLPEQFIDNVLASPQSVMASQKFERFEAVFAGAGDTLSAALAALLASGTPLPEAVTEALNYLDRSLNGGFRPGMGHVIPDRLFWAQPEEDSDGDANGDDAAPKGLSDPGKPDTSRPSATDLIFNLPAHDTKH
jgi:hydroxymethylpyrimidine/phosphomethylpyrimidine kinase